VASAAPIEPVASPPPVPAAAAAPSAAAAATAAAAPRVDGEFSFSAAAIAAAEGRRPPPRNDAPPDDDGPPHPALAEGSSPTPAPVVAAAPRPANGAAPRPANGAAPVAGAPVPSTPEAMLREWEAVIGDLENARKMTLVNAYLHARIVEWKPDEIVVGFAADDLIAEVAGERDALDQMATFLGERYSRPVKLSVRRLAPGEATATDSARSLIEVDTQRRAAERSTRESEAREHPATRMVLQTFGASIKEIKTDV
jgi:hypothetical protein